MSCPLSHTKCQVPGVKVRAIRRAFVDVAGHLHLVRIAAACSCSVSCLDSCSAPGRGWLSTHVRRLHELDQKRRLELLVVRKGACFRV